MTDERTSATRKRNVLILISSLPIDSFDTFLINPDLFLIAVQPSNPASTVKPPRRQHHQSRIRRITPHASLADLGPEPDLLLGGLVVQDVRVAFWFGIGRMSGGRETVSSF